MVFLVLQLPGAGETGIPLTSSTLGSSIIRQHLQLPCLKHGDVIPNLFPKANDLRTESLLPILAPVFFTYLRAVSKIVCHFLRFPKLVKSEILKYISMYLLSDVENLRLYLVPDQEFTK